MSHDIFSKKHNGKGMSLIKADEGASSAYDLWLSCVVSRACDKFFERRGLSSGADYNFFATRKPERTLDEEHS
jgi:hypothetical protein